MNHEAHIHWAAKYIGLDYEPAARGPEKVDCWGLVVVIYLNQFQILLPLYPGLSLANPVKASNAIRSGLEEAWTEVKRPFEGALVAMSQRKEIHHIGVFVLADGGRVLHCWNAQKVVADTVRNLRLRGMRTIKYYRHQQWPTS